MSTSVSQTAVNIITQVCAAGPPLVQRGDEVGVATGLLKLSVVEIYLAGSVVYSVRVGVRNDEVQVPISS